MKLLALSIALLGSTVIVSANQYYPNNSNGFNTPNFNWGNNGSSWSMPNMNWGNNNGYNNRYNSGSSWHMPNFNWGSNNRGTSWSMPSMNWGNNNGYGSGSNWSMPNFNWGNGYNSGNNWNMPGMNWGNKSRPWNFGNSTYNAPRMPNYRFVPNPAYNAPMPQFKAQTIAPPKLVQPKITPPSMNVQAPKAPVANAAPALSMPKRTTQDTEKLVKDAIKDSMKDAVKTHRIPMPSEVKGVILSPENTPKVSPELKTPVK